MGQCNLMNIIMKILEIIAKLLKYLSLVPLAGINTFLRCCISSVCPVHSPQCPLGGAEFPAQYGTESTHFPDFKKGRAQGGWPPQEESCFSVCLLSYQMKFKIELCG
ncbi:hypothetical protein ATANTOWER_005805 [Ataeniobius toweri]|uniref:Uncharacterized protein n=1 Tax=Ataeniobius toweri TaxID=208326 RepID=A0ABU7AEI0_9TELE|nr:hypothetical protein [Ataeniobius toweri]